MDKVERWLRDLNDPDWGVRSNAAMNVPRAAKDDERTMPALLKALEDENDDVRVWATIAVGRIGGEAAVPALIRMLDDVEDDVRYNAAEWLVHIGDPAIAPLTELLRHGKSELRERAAAALDNIGLEKLDLDDRVLCLCISNVGIWIFVELVKIREIGEPAVPALVKTLEDEDVPVAKRAANALVILAERMDVNLSKVAASLHEYTRKKRDGEEYDEARKWAGEAYIEIASVVSKRKHAQMGGVLSTGKIKPPKKGMYRKMRRAVA